MADEEKDGLRGPNALVLGKTSCPRCSAVLLTKTQFCPHCGCKICAVKATTDPVRKDVVDIRKLWWQKSVAIVVTTLLLMAAIEVFSFILHHKIRSSFEKFLILFVCPVSFWSLIIFLLILICRRWAPAIGFPCPHCGKHLSTDQPWVCGYCDHANNPSKYTHLPSVIYGCERSTCGKRPKAYRCYHCNHDIYFDLDDRDNRHIAVAVGKPRPPIIIGQTTPSEIDPQEERLKEVERDKERLRKEINIAKGKKEVEALQGELDGLGGATSEDDPVEIRLKNLEAVIQAREKAILRVSNNSDYSADTKRTLIDYIKRIAQGQINTLKLR